MSPEGPPQAVAVAREGPRVGHSMLMYMLLLYRYAFRYFEMGYASAMAIVMFVAILILTLILLKTSGRWVYYETSGQV